MISNKRKEKKEKTRVTANAVAKNLLTPNQYQYTNIFQGRYKQNIQHR